MRTSITGISYLLSISACLCHVFHIQHVVETFKDVEVVDEDQGATCPHRKADTVDLRQCVCVCEVGGLSYPQP